MSIQQFRIFRFLVACEDCEELNEFLDEIGERCLSCDWDFYQDGGSAYLVCRVSYLVDEDELLAKKKEEEEDDDDDDEYLRRLEEDFKHLEESQAHAERKRYPH